MPIKNKVFYAAASADCTMRAVDNADGKMMVQGYAMLFNSPTVLYRVNDMDYKEVILPGALDDCDMSDVVLDRGHDMSKALLARNKNNTLSLEVDERGLKFTAELPDTQEGRDTYALVKRGDLFGCSFAAVVKEQSFETPTRTWKIRSFCRLFDVAIVTFPAYPETEVSAERRSIFGLDMMDKQEKFEIEKARLLALCM